VETKQCSDCHVSADGDNNAWMASVLMLGMPVIGTGPDGGGAEQAARRASERSAVARSVMGVI